MSWRDNLQDASFRGFPFKVSVSETGVGRRNVVHQYPQRDTPYIEDLGQDTDEFVVTGYVIQNRENGFNYFEERDNLIFALREPGPGTLIHPFLGSQRVSLVGKARIRETFDRGGIATFDMTFVRTDDEVLLISTIDYIGTVDESVTKSTNNMCDCFVQNFVIPTLGYSREGIIADATKFIAMNKKAVLAVKGSLSTSISQALGVLSTNIVNINDILSTPSDCATMINSSVGSFLYLIGEEGEVVGGVLGDWSGEYIGEVVTLPGDSLPIDLGTSAVLSLVEMNRFGESLTESDPSSYGGQLEDIDVITENRARQSLNRIYMVNLIRGLALINACKVAIRISYSSYNQAIEMLNSIVNAMDDYLEKLGDEAADDTYRDYNFRDDNNEMYSAIVQLRADFIKAMKNIGASLAVIIDYKCPADGITSLEIAYDRYMDLDRAEDIFQRNKIRVQHPGLLPGGQNIEILSE